MVLIQQTAKEMENGNYYFFLSADYSRISRHIFPLVSTAARQSAVGASL
jgi:hypothetical protein